MTDEYDTKMLAALDRLVARYGPRPVIRLAELIRDPQRAQDLAAQLETSAAKATKGRARPKTQRGDRVGMSVLKAFRLSDPEKHAVIAEIRRELLAGTSLASMDGLRRFAMMHDLSIGKASSRRAAVTPFLRSLSQLSTPEILSLSDSILQSDIDDRSLDSWRNVIVRPPTRSNPTDTKP